jgi:hypothetical protein
MGMGMGLDSESCQEQKLNACLALGNLSMASTVTIDDDIYKYEKRSPPVRLVAPSRPTLI